MFFYCGWNFYGYIKIITCIVLFFKFDNTVSMIYVRTQEQAIIDDELFCSKSSLFKLELKYGGFQLFINN